MTRTEGICRSPLIAAATPRVVQLSRGGATAASVGATIGVIHLTDTLDAGGRERIAVNIVNSMPRDRYRTFVCTTRRDGPLLAMLADDVGRLSLQRRRTVDFRAVARLAGFIRRNRISVIHAHGTSLVVAYLASLLVRDVVLVWHDHFGTNEQRERAVPLYRMMTRRVSAVLAVSQPLAEWARRRLRFRENRIWCLPNFVPLVHVPHRKPTLPGTPGGRIVCVANLRPVKNQLTLLEAMKIVLEQHPGSHLILVGERGDAQYAAAVERRIEELGIEDNVALLGPRDDVRDILPLCDIGVLSSTSEGLPVSLLEYGAAGLAVVVTDVGQCRQVLEDGAAGKLVSAGSAQQLAASITSLLCDPEERLRLGRKFRDRVLRHYSAEAVINQLDGIYSQVLQR